MTPCWNFATSAGARELEAPKYKCEAPIMRVWKQSPQRGPEVEPLVKGTEGRSPSREAETPLAFGRSLKAANLPTFKKNWKCKKSDTLCVVIAKNEV